MTMEIMETERAVLQDANLALSLDGLAQEEASPLLPPA